MNYFSILFVCGCLICVLFIIPCYLLLYVVLFLLGAIWLLTQHVTERILKCYYLLNFISIYTITYLKICSRVYNFVATLWLKYIVRALGGVLTPLGLGRGEVGLGVDLRTGT
jgi:hypothetical protein